MADKIEKTGIGYGINGKFPAPIDTPSPNATPVYTVNDFINIRNNLSGSYVLMKDIDLSGQIDVAWTAIGTNNKRFTGVFDGQGHTISNLTISGLGDNYNGLFGYIYNATIKNLGVENVNIKIKNTFDVSIYAGGICAYAANSSSINNCYYTGSISVSASSKRAKAYVGGICGFSTSNNIIYCYNTGSMSASVAYSSSSDKPANAGGICGISSHDKISYCYNTGTISVAASATAPNNCVNAGGICGNSDYVNINNCYNTGSANAVAKNKTYLVMVGGICGSSKVSVINNCYNKGSMSGQSAFATYTSGICGNTDSVTISNCVVLSDKLYAYCSDKDGVECNMIGSKYSIRVNNLALKSITGAVNDATSIITLDEAKSKSTYEGLDWDFTEIWAINPKINDGFPYLNNEPITQLYALSVIAKMGGVISREANGEYKSGYIIKLEASPLNGYRFVKWTSSNGGIFADADKPSTSFTMPKNDTLVIASFEPLNTPR